jgi:hypothetical protein
MKAGSIQILDLDFEFKLWKNKLYFYQAEIEILNGRMIVLDLEHPEIKIKVNLIELLNRQHSAIKAVLNRIEILEQEMALYAEDYPVNQKHIHVQSHEGIREEMEQVADTQAKINSFVYPELCFPQGK